ncbi:uncharacterized protein LOC124616105 [Schistocerca americana]|uniref:uncharacterized protein LOC124616105 n=1 Tax=Schistocerca americana TaxID=7009 RepID=UPI001F501698|nr:uncharacterized protein LOC124616105 [Schistocerca americana]
MLLPLLLATLAAGPVLSEAAPAPAPQAAARSPTEITADPEQLELLSAYLTRLLVDGWPEGEPPLLYVEGADDDDVDAAERDNVIGNGAQPIWKRSRYYRRYPWKRQNGRYQAADDRYLCQPTREDVFQLLVALHEARRGDSSRTVSFCNRRRPASAIFTNIRFLGR